MTPAQFSDAFAEIKPPFDPQSAVVEANRCLYCFDAPCTAACPTHIDVPRFIKKISTGNLRGSATAILDSNILGLSCSRVCPVDVLCEGACVMHRYNKQPIEIGKLQRHAMDVFYANGAKLASVPVTRSERIACIGAGPASLACAAELRQRGYLPTIFEARAMPGGLNTYGVAEYKLRPRVSLLEVELVRSLGVEIRTGVAIGDDLTLDSLERDFAAIFVGVGLGPTEKLGIPGENLGGVIDAVQFIARYKTGEPPIIASNVVVIGGGNTAIDAAVAANLLGAEHVTIAYRRDRQAMPAFDFEYEHARQSGVHFLWQTLPVAIRSDDGESANRVECVRTELGPPDGSGRRTPQPIPGSDFAIECGTVIIALGQTKLSRLLAGRDVAFEGACIAANRATGQTSNPQYFAAGDCVNGGGEVVDAVADGKRAGHGIAHWLEAKHG
jgi:glutamate synthase (NADPH/NADH) small chain